MLSISLTPLHYVYLIGVICILFVMILRKDTPIACIVFLFFTRHCGYKQCYREAYKTIFKSNTICWKGIYGNYSYNRTCYCIFKMSYGFRR